MAHGCRAEPARAVDCCSNVDVCVVFVSNLHNHAWTRALRADPRALCIVHAYTRGTNTVTPSQSAKLLAGINLAFICSSIVRLAPSTAVQRSRNSVSTAVCTH